MIESSKSKKIDEYLCSLRKSSSIDPNKTPSYSIIEWLYYMLIFCIDYPLILFFESTCLLLSIYGVLKSKYNSFYTYTKKQNIYVNNNNINKKLSFISIIISCYNESDNIEQLLLYLEKHCFDKKNTEIILIDGGSTDKWWTKLPKYNQKLNKLISFKLKLIKYSEHKQSGRGTCQSIGVKYCNKNTDILLFLHADTIVCNKFDEIIRNNLSNNNNIVCGAFRFGLDCSKMAYPIPGFNALIFRVNLDTYLCSLPFGDQGIHLTLNMYHKLNGIPNQCIMEDYEFIRNARNIAYQNNMKIYIENNKLYTSPRKYYKSKRIWKNTLINQYVIYLYEHLHYSPEKIYQIYYGKSLPTY